MAVGECGVLRRVRWLRDAGWRRGRAGLSAPDARALIVRLLPQNLPDRAGWATDVYAAFATQDIAATAENICAVLAVTEQESTFRAIPGAGLAKIAGQEIDSKPSGPAFQNLRCTPRCSCSRRTARATAIARRGHYREAAERNLRRLYWHRPARQDVSGQPQSGSHRRPNAGEHCICRGSQLVYSVSVSDCAFGPA